MQTDKLAQALERFVNTEDWEEARRTVEENQDLLSDRAQELLSENIEDYRQAERDDVADYLQEHRDLLKRSRQVGIDRAFQEAEQHAQQTLDARRNQLDALRPQTPSPLQATVWQLLDSQSPEELDRVLKEHPELSRSEDALNYVDELMGLARQSGSSEAEHYLREYHELLRSFFELPPLMRALQEFMTVPTWSESRDVLKAHPDLMSPEAVQTLDSLIEEAESESDEASVKVLRAYRQVLERAQQVGPDQAIEEIMQTEMAQ